MYFDVTLEKPRICDFVYVLSPAEVIRYYDPYVLSSRHTFKFCVVKEVLGRNGCVESGHMEDLSFCGIKVHIPLIFPLFQLAKVFL